MFDPGATASTNSGWFNGSWRKRTAIIFTGMPTQVAWIGGMLATDPTSSALAWKASVTAGPPVIWAHCTWNVRSLIQPVCLSTRSVTGSPITSFTPGGTVSGIGASSARPPAASRPVRANTPR